PAPSTYASPAPASAPAAAPAKAYRPPAAAAPAVASSGKAVGFPINFDTGSATIRPDSVAFLESIGGLLQKDAAMHMVIEGHTDARGNYQSNMELSRARANSVASYLAGRYGVEASRLQVVGKGPMEPLVPADPYAADNRRVQFRIVN
ncbi:MAG: OmpA family protein, partial [Rhodospirillales bacterium]|nr:OmpA family protein [Rhodospirillales bacterium]